MTEKELERAARRLGTPVYVYDASKIIEQCEELKKNLSDIDLYYACKANTNPEIVKIIYKEGYGIETVSPGEIAVARKAGVPTSKITFTCGSIRAKELISIKKQGVRIHLDSLEQVKTFGENFPGQEISVRLNLRIGGGHHSHVITGGPDSKFGIDVSHLTELKNLASKYRLKITGLHQHIGSNILDIATFMDGVKVLFKTALQFPHLKYLDFGGGFGVPYMPGEKNLELKKLGQAIKKEHENFSQKFGRKIPISFEPGRFLVAQAGSLLVEVTDIKQNPSKTFIGVNSGMNHLIRHSMYGSYHEIVNISNPKTKKEKVTIAGNICESGDVFAKDRLIAKPRIGDILAIRDAGAYGYAMSSEYNSRPKPREFLMLGNKIKKI